MKIARLFVVGLSCIALVAIYYAASRLRFAPDGQSLQGVEHPRRIDGKGGEDVLQFEKPVLDLGDIRADDEANVKITVRNISNATVEITKINTTCSCLSASGGVGLKLSPDEPGVVEMKLKPKAGTIRWPLQIVVSQGQVFEYVLVGHAYRDVMLSADNVALGAIVQGSSRDFLFSVLGDTQNCEIGKISSSVEWISAVLKSDSDSLATNSSLTTMDTRNVFERKGNYHTLAKVAVTVSPKLLGNFREFITVPVTTPHGSRNLMVSLSGLCTKEVYSIPERLVFDHENSKKTLLIRSQTEFDVIGVEINGERLDTTVPNGSMKVIRLEIRLPEAVFQAATAENPVVCRVLLENCSVPHIDVPVIVKKTGKSSPVEGIHETASQ